MKLIPIVFLLSLTGCQHIVGAYNTLHELKTQYCSVTSPEARSYIVEQIRRREPDYSPVCGESE